MFFLFLPESPHHSLFHYVHSTKILIVRAISYSFSIHFFLLKSCAAQVWVKGWDVMKAPHMESLWITRVPTDHACRTITRADEMKLNKMNGMKEEKCWDEICGRGNREKPREKPTQTTFRHHEIHIKWPRRELWIPAPGGRRTTD